MATKAEAIMKVACMLAGRDLTGEYGPTIANAIDAFVDALAGRDIQSPDTIADAIGGLGEQTASIAEGIGSLRDILQAEGVDTGSGSLAETLAAAVSYTGQGGGGNPPEIDFATEDEVRNAFRTA